MFKYENLSNTVKKSPVDTAENILANGWSRRGYPVCLLSSIPWAMKDSSERSWNFLIHCLDMIDPLLKSYDVTGNLKWLHATKGVIFDWVEFSESQEDNDESMLWYDMAVGIRAYRLAYFYEQAVLNELMSESERSALWKSMLAHAKYLQAESNIIFHNNHGLYQVAGQLAMGRRLFNLDEIMQHSLELGKQRLETMITQQFAEDGIHKEHSPDYHRMVYETLKAMDEAELIDPKWKPHLVKIEKALANFITPSGNIVNFGDSDSRAMRIKPRHAKAKWQTTEMAYVVTNGELGNIESGLTVYEQGGYFVIRDFLDAGHYQDSSYLAQIAAFHSRAHKHADDLSFVWSEFGVDIILDAGRYGYLGKAEQGSDLWKDGYWYSDPNRVYVESTKAHSTLEFNGENYQRKAIKPYGSAIGRSHSICVDGKMLYAIETECKHSSSIKRSRLIIYSPRDFLIIVDWFKDYSDDVHHVKQWFQVSPELNLVENSCVLAFSNQKMPKLFVDTLISDFKFGRASKGETDISGNPCSGWWSPGERKITPCTSIFFETENQLSTASAATILTFSEKSDFLPLQSDINVSGRKGVLRWFNSGRKNELRFSRQINDGIQLDFTRK